MASLNFESNSQPTLQKWLYSLEYIKIEQYTGKPLTSSLRWLDHLEDANIYLNDDVNIRFSHLDREPNAKPMAQV